MEALGAQTETDRSSSIRKNMNADEVTNF